MAFLFLSSSRFWHLPLFSFLSQIVRGAQRQIRPCPNTGPDDAAEVAPVEEAEDLQLDLHREGHEARPRLHRYTRLSILCHGIEYFLKIIFLLHTFHKYRRMKRYKNYTW